MPARSSMIVKARAVGKPQGLVRSRPMAAFQSSSARRAARSGTSSSQSLLLASMRGGAAGSTGQGTSNRPNFFPASPFAALTCRSPLHRTRDRRLVLLRPETDAARRLRAAPAPPDIRVEYTASIWCGSGSRLDVCTPRYGSKRYAGEIRLASETSRNMAPSPSIDQARPACSTVRRGSSSR